MTQWNAWSTSEIEERPGQRPLGATLRAGLLILLATLAACRTPAGIVPPVNPQWEQRRQVLEALDTWSFTASIRVRDEEESHSSRIRWQQREARYQINLWGAFNAGATEITGEPGRVVISQRGEDPIITETPEELVYQELGYELPVSWLDNWLKGIPAPDSPAQTRFGENGQLVDLVQSGWHIQYLGYVEQNPETLPARIRIEKPPLRVDLVRMTWTTGPDGEK
ncbi:MAG: lipoprotein insertase outer membrane protein LolB [Pseudohongiellaceae bacterium]